MHPRVKTLIASVTLIAPAIDCSNTSVVAGERALTLTVSGKHATSRDISLASIFCNLIWSADQ